jgi:ABC-2 type transport system ATP-binding protein
VDERPGRERPGRERPWLDALAAHLARHGVAAQTARQVVEEAAAHLRDSGEAAGDAFGDAAGYAAAVADSVGRADRAAPGRPAGPVLLRARGITKRYGRRTILRDVDLTAYAGQVTAITGANGSGKSTLLRICAGLVSPDAGTVHLAGAVGYCPQDGGTVDLLSGDEHFVLVGAGRGLARGPAREQGREWAKRLHWTQPGSQVARHLSGGTRQKLNLTLSALGEPDVLLLDEPYQGFDHGTYVDFWEQVWHWRERGRAVVVVTHRLGQLDRVDAVLDLTGVQR